MLTLIQTILALLLIAGVLIQQRGEGLSSVFGGDGSAYSTRRGAEKFVFFSTVVIAIVFFSVSLIRILQ
jgi:protein translocase SecG subunit